MTTGDLESRVKRLEKAALALHSTNLKLMNREYVLRALMCALLERLSNDELQEVASGYDKYILTILDQVPPEHQVREILEEMDEMLSRRTPPEG